MPEIHPAIIARELSQASELVDEWSNETLCDDSGDELDADQLRERLTRFAELAHRLDPRLEWVLINAGGTLSGEQRTQLSVCRGGLALILQYQEAVL